MRLVLPACVVSLAAFSPVASAGEGDESARARAEASFEDGLTRQRLGQLQAACESFEASVESAPSPHALLQVGNCREPLDPARALASFEAALVAAGEVVDPRQRQAYEGAARERIEPLLARVASITFRPSPTPGVSVQVVTAPGKVTRHVTRFGEPLRMNPGKYRVRASAVGAIDHVIEVELEAGQRLEVALPALGTPAPHGADLVARPAPLAGAPATSRLPSPELSESERAASWELGDEATELRFEVLPLALAGGGAALIVASLVTGQVSSAARRKLDRECDERDDVTGARPCNEALAGTKRQVEDYALATDVLWVGGALLAGAGVTLFVVDQATPESTRLGASCFGTGCGVSAAGSF